MDLSSRKTLFPENFTLNSDELAFYKKHTGIQDEEKLKEHIMDVAGSALEVYPYYCIRSFGFLRFRIIRSKAGYKKLLELCSTRQNALFLDLGCCFGNDIRKAVEDGFPAEKTIASDLYAGAFFPFLCVLFIISMQISGNSDTSYSILPRPPFRFTFISGDIFDSSFISIQPPLKTLTLSYDDNTEPISYSRLFKPNPSRWTSSSHLSVIHTSAVFHLYDRDAQLLIAKKIASLLSPLPGSIIFGSHTGSKVPREVINQSTQMKAYRHSPESWKKMWEEEVFDKDKDMFQVEAGFEDEIWMSWIVTRL
ncbi:hypothetical protein BT96DRAFT_696297 [Gymnopus androsaceus JB14]|uniref:Methyltransferase domain-containing protein n=1 Tax=Gymnopus androsaceus JB14 TaxID=1447944 RepID=A0A6A4ICL9_9AGAR|nr:hypothetical protein BT96DRAFT_696297 [Gymnopus androsaceus JB14]